MSISDLDFTIRTFKILLSNAKSNIAYSPYSVFSCLVAAALIAKPRSQDEIFKALSISSPDAIQPFLSQFKKPDVSFPPSFPKLLECLSSPKLNSIQKQALLKEISKGNAEEDIQAILTNKDKLREMSYLIMRLSSIPAILSSNQLWANENIFKDEMKGARAVKLPQPGCDIINKFIEEETEGLIKNLIDPGSISPNTSLILTNTVYFKANWEIQFSDHLTKKNDFYLLDGKTISVDFMRKEEEKFRYYENDQVQVLILPYHDTPFVFAIFLPKKKTEIDFLNTSTLVADNLLNFVGQTKENPVNVTIPKFKIEWGSSLVETLKQIGIKNAFNEPDFYGSSISEVIQKAVIIVDEKGTEATAATAVIMALCFRLPPPNPIEFVADHPFIYSLMDPAQKNVLFIGTCLSPSFS